MLYIHLMQRKRFCDLYIVFGQTVRKLRITSGLTQRALAANLGFSLSYLSRLERGKAEVQIKHMEKLASAFGMTYPQLWQHTEALRQMQGSLN